jgi:hypothetical protein
VGQLEEQRLRRRPSQQLEGVLHLATAEYLVRQRQRLSLATYDERMRTCAERMGLTLAAI